MPVAALTSALVRAEKLTAAPSATPAGMLRVLTAPFSSRVPSTAPAFVTVAEEGGSATTWIVTLCSPVPPSLPVTVARRVSGPSGKSRGMRKTLKLSSPGKSAVSSVAPAVKRTLCTSSGLNGWTEKNVAPLTDAPSIGLLMTKTGPGAAGAGSLDVHDASAPCASAQTTTDAFLASMVRLLGFARVGLPGIDWGE